MQSFFTLWSQIWSLESGFRHDAVYRWHVHHVDVPIFACCVYFVMVFWLPGFLERKNLKYQLANPMIAWNLLLAVFSILGAIRTVPVVVEGLRDGGFEATVCGDGNHSWMDGKIGFWILVFVYSKIPELVDTLFLVLRRRKVIFLHWFHHCTVLLFCWHSWMTKARPGLWFATMNYCVHAIMYSYFTAMAAKVGNALAPLAPFITLLQILQMVGGMVIILAASRRLVVDGACEADLANMRLGFAMYASYFALFFMLFWDKYMTEKQDLRRTMHRLSQTSMLNADPFAESPAASPIANEAGKMKGLLASEQSEGETKFLFA